MRFITCSSYYGTGSSAVTDFVSEFKNVYSFTEEEFRFIQDPYGISDLEFNLIEGFNRHNSGYALKRFKRLVDFYSGGVFGKKYSTFLGDKWKEYAYRYIDELTDFTYPGYGFYDLYDRGIFYYYIKSLPNKLLHMTIWRNNPERTLNVLKNERTYCSHPTEVKFLCATRRFIYDLFSSVVPDGYDTIMVDQLLPPNNLQRYLRYFDNNIQTVVVDRDPRDVFILDKYYWKDGRIPNEAETFCKWYKYTRSHRKTENMQTDQVRFIQFEDLVYNYQKTTETLAAWLNLDPVMHTSPKTKFDPARSIKNTQVWKNVPGSETEITIIEKELTDYLYPFPSDFKNC
ncbi:MAG: hypothetical protein IJI14_09855 [Anaerolineaceae bacterium]|nr:hypothetical protein [Anaerolineaceae bacterium]